MLNHRLPDHLGVCEIDGRVLMLDLRRDRYLELDPGSSSTMRSWRAGCGDPADDPGLLRLVERGMLVPAGVGEPACRTACKVPVKSLIGRAPPPDRSAWTVVPEIAVALWRTRRLLKRAGLEAAASDIRRRKATATAGDPLFHLSRFKAARRLVPLTPNCLTDSLALAAFLSRRGVRSDLVFGVKLNPFAAHCWLQNDDAVLNDAADCVATFTPILVV